MFKPILFSMILSTVLLLVSQADAAEVIVDSVADLTWSDAGGASSSVTSDVLTIQTSKNSSVAASLPAAVSIPAMDDFITVTFDVTLDNVPANTSSAFEVGFRDSASGDYFYKVALNPLGGTQGATFSEGGDSNLGKDDTLAFGTTTHTLWFTLTKIATDTGLSLTAAGGLINEAGNTATRNADLGPPPQTTTFDTLFFGFTGNAWNETFGAGADTVTATIENLSVTTSAIPEPGSAGLVGLGLLCVLGRRRRWR